MENNITIVVARYNESVEWTNPFPNVIIYNKGETPLDSNYNERKLPNVGREGHTYYTYIYDHYENLPDFVVFLQGHPFDHYPDIINQLNTYIHTQNLNIDFEWLSNRILYTNLSGCPNHKDIPLVETYETLFQEKKTEMEFIFGAGGQFVVSKNRILNRPKEFYANVVELLNKEINPIEGFVIERFHHLIFS